MNRGNIKIKLTLAVLMLLTLVQGVWATTANVSTYAELCAAIADASVDNIVVTANIDVPCETSGNAGNTDLTGASTAQLIINRSLTLQSQAGSKYIIKRVAANGATSSALKSMIAIRGNGHGNSGTDNLSENTVEVSFTNIIIDGGANWGSTSVSDRYNAAADACGCSGRATIDIYLGATLNLEDGVEVQNGFTTKSDNSLLNDPSGSKCFGGAIRVDYHNNTGGGTINIKAGATIHDCTARNGYGGALGAYNYARLNLYGGTIYNCSASNGGAIACTYRSAAGYGNTTAGTIRMYGGTISNCCAVNGGAFLMHGQDVDDYFLGGTITSCQATSGGAMYVGESNSTPNVHLVAHSSGWLTISSCTNTNVTSTESTGGYDYVYINTGTITETPVYQVTFRNNNTDFAVLHVLQGNSLGEAFPAAPVNADFRFVGWYNGNTQITSSTAITGNMTVTAKWDFLGSGTEGDPYQIPSADVWNFLADKVSAGNSYSGEYFQLTEDIGTAQAPITSMVGVYSGTESNLRPFSGTFDGNGHTLTVDYSGNDYETRTAPFSFVYGATIRNLIVAGNCGTAGRAAGIVGECNSLSTITNCVSSVTISGGPYIGGISIGGYYHIEGCLFNGTINGTSDSGGFVGYGENVTEITNCLFAPQDGSSISGGTFYYVGSGGVTVTNSYYTTALGAAQGKQARSISAGDDVTINNLGEGTEYNVSGITAYAHGIKYGGTYYAGNGDEVSLSLSHVEAPLGNSFSQYTVSGGGTLANQTTNSPTLTMTDANQTINVEWAFNTLTFNYTGEVQTFTVPATGYYKLVCYGAQGGYSSSGLGGKGGLSQLTYPLTQGDVLYIYVGGQGECIDGSSSHPEGGDGGWNGGGKGGEGVAYGGNGNPYNGGGGGGGATHIATSAIGAITGTTDFNANHDGLLLIAGGGGGGLSWGPSAGGVGGGDTGGNGHRSNDEWNIAWNNGTLSCGKDGMTSSTGGGSCEGCGGGGGGYQGGNTWTVSYNASNQSYSGAGGSSWGETTNGSDYSTTLGGATAGGNGKAQITLLLQGSGIEEDPYLISSEEAWNYLADQVNAGNTYSGKFVRLTNDISVTTMVGNSESNSFRGTFDGDGHTLTISYNTTSDYTAPFRYIQGATFKNLKVTGSITTTMNLAAGIAGLNTNAAATFEQCVTDVTINSSSTTEVGWGRVDYHGGFLARTNSANVNITDCVCGGSVDGSNSDLCTAYCAGFVGVAVSCTVTGTRCLNTTSYTNVSITNSLCHTADATRSVDVFYYVNGNDGACPGTPVTTSQLADGSIFTALEAACTESVWAQDPITNQPMLKMFANDGKLPGEFTINAGGGKVNFSHGNLQYQANSTGAASAPYTGVWRFAANQYEAIGSGNSNVSASYGGWIDFFGWGSGNQPTQTSEDPNTYSSFVDWGTNVISNGGNTANLWRTLSESEWTYIISTRPNASNKRGRATINGMYCYVLLPDDWVLPSGLSFTPDANNWTNVYTVEQWAQMEAAGAVCLPASGSRAGGANNTNVNDYNHWGCYWSSTSANSTQGYNLWFTPDYVGTTDKGNYKMGASVRLVYEAPLQGTGTEQDPYLISSEADWYYLANKVNNGNDYSGKFFRQTADISVTTMVGVSDLWSFSGTYDGDGKTLNLNLDTTTPHTAPFRFIANATIKNVVTTGSVYSTSYHPSGLVGITDGTCTIQNCRVSANVGGPQYLGGIVGHCYHANISIIGCVYTGTLTPASGQKTGGLIGWGGDGGGHTISISNCLFAGSLNGSTTFHPVGILQNTSNTRTVSNTYYTLAHNMSNEDTHGNSFVNGLSYKGKFARSISGETGVTVANTGDATEYDVSGITSYGTGILYDGVLYAGNGESIALTLSHGNKEGFTFNRYTVTGGGTLDNETSNTPTLTMTDANQEINAQWIGVNPNWSYTSSGNVLSAYGEGGYTEEDPLSITISAPADLQFDGTYKSATISNTSAWTAASLTVPTILYNGITHAPSLLGDYTASITAGGATAEVTFTIKSVINYQSIFDGGLTRGKNFDVIATTGAYEVELNNTDNKGVYWDAEENCAVFDGEAYLQIDNPLGNVTAETGLTLTMDVYISSENNGTGTFIRSTGVEANKNGWQRLFELSDGNPEDCIFINAGNANNGTAHLMWCLRKGYEVNKLEVWNNTGKSYNNQWCTVTMVVAPGGYTTLYVNGEVLTHSSSSEDVSKITNVLNYISSYNKCYIGTSIFEVIGSNADGFFIGKIRGFQTAEGALMPYFDGTNYHYLLSYATNGGNPIIGTFEATIPENLPTPTHPDANAVFLGWYMDEELTIPAVSGTALTRNTALYAKWINPSDYKLPGAFSISDAKRVCFSQGNLQYQASTDTWQFAEHQYNYIGNAAGNTAPSASQTAWIDLFGWATSGYNDKYPYMTSVTNSDYSTGVSVDSDFDSNYDWGTQAADNIGTGWRTLTHAEWVYLFNTRNTSATVNSISDARYTMATINTDGTSVNGVILFPDHFDGSAAYSGVSWGTINGTSDWGSGTSCTTAGWTALQNAGCVFLPAAGYREGTTVGETGTQGGYWSSTTSTTEASYALRFVSNTLEPEFSCHWKYGYSVRLVSETPFIGLGTEANPYLISSKEDWDNLAAKVSAGNTYNNKYFQQTADIGTPQDPITRMVGIYSNNISERRPFSGTFDGDGHVLYPSYNNTDSYLALFSNVNGATIKNLRVRGVIQSIGQHLAGLVGHAEGNVTITNCDIRPRITFTCSEAKSGGVVGELASGATLEVNGCVFGGSLEGSNIIGVAGFVWAASGAIVRLTDCLFTPSSLEHLNSNESNWTFLRGSDVTHTITNCYYTQALVTTSQGKHARTITAGTDVTISGLGAASATYNVSDITAYTHGIKYNGVYYAGNEDEVSLTLSNDKSGFLIIQYTVTGGGTLTNPATDTPTLTMTDADQVISATWRKLLMSENSNGWMTCYSTEDLTVGTDEMETYVVTEVTSTTITTSSTEGKIYKDTPMLLKRKDSYASDVYGYVSTVELTPPTGLSEAYIGGKSTFEGYTEGTVYVLAGSEFVRARVTASTEFSPSKCFIYLTTGNASSRLSIVGDGETTGLQTIDNATEETWYTIDGRKLSTRPTHTGIYIRNGKKVVVK